MDLIVIILIAIVLSIDAFSVVLATGLIDRKHVIRMSFSFGIFQGLMPVLGWLSGNEMKNLISSFDHWIAFFILSAIGLKMIYESFQEKEFKIDFKMLISLSLATSIDAFAIGITLSVLNSPIILPAIIIAVVTFLLCISVFFITHRIKLKKAEIFGGLVLILIGLKILIEHVT